MKNLLISMLFLCSVQINAQTVAIDTCNSYGNTRASSADLNSYFMAQAVNLDHKYDWGNQAVNCHINSTIQAQKHIESVRKKIRSNSQLGQILYYPGSAFLLVGILTGSPGLIVPGVIGAGAGFAISLGGLKKQKLKIENYQAQSQYHMNEVSKFYRSMGW